MKVDSLKNDEAEIQKTDLVPEVKPALKVRKKSFKNPKFKNTINKKIMIHKQIFRMHQLTNDPTFRPLQINNIGKQMKERKKKCSAEVVVRL